MSEKEFTVFGIPWTAKQEKDLDVDISERKSFVAPTNNDGAVIVDRDEGMSAGGAYYQRMNYGLSYKDESELINKYRAMALTADVAGAIDEIVNEVMSFDANEAPVSLILDSVDFSDNIKKKINEEFVNILSLIKFNTEGDDLFKRWYVDGRLYHHIVVDNASKAKKDGISEIRYIDPRKIKKIQEVIKKRNPITSIEEVVGTDEYYVYQENNSNSISSTIKNIRIPVDAISYVHSGITDEDKSENTVILSFLHKAIKPWNLLNMMEDAEVIYKISRAPERRIFYIDVGNLPKTKADAHLTSIISKYKNKLVYNSQTGSIKDSTNTMSMLEDIWLPRREGSRGTEVSTLPGGTGLGDIENTQYFRKKLYTSMHLPLSRIESADSQFSLGGDSITRDELKFSKFVTKLRKRFSKLFLNLLKVQLLLKNVISADDWEELAEDLRFRFNLDLYFQELKESETRNTQIAQLDSIDAYVGRYFSIEYVHKKILKHTDEEIEDIQKQIEKEKEEEKMPDDAGFDPQGTAGGIEDVPADEPTPVDDEPQA